jgi:hypothetical protein
MRFRLLFLFALPAAADTLTLTWTAPTQREDGTALTAAEIANYRVTWTLAGSPLAPFTVPGNVSTWTLEGLAPGKYCLRMSTIDTENLESVPSEEVCRKAKPNPPGNVKAR